MSSTSFELKNKIYRAGAGAGKTTSLVNEVTSFFLHYYSIHKSYPKIVLTTFTRKATQEMRERLMINAQKLKNEELLNFVMSKSQLHISTIHGVLQMFLRQFGYLIEIDPGFKIITGSENYKIASRILKKIIVENEKFQELLEFFEFSELISGSMAFYDVFIINQNINCVDMATYESSMSAVFEKFKERATNVANSIEAETEDAGYLMFADQLKTLSGKFEVEIWKSNYSEVMNLIGALNKPRKNSKNPKVSDLLESECASLKDDLKDLEAEKYSVDQWQKSVALCADLNELFKQFSAQFYSVKINSGQLQMSDLETLSYKLLLERSDSLANFSKQWDYWLIDEFQDTSPLQVSVLNQLVGQTKHFVVGDPQQSIYFFRGAREKVFENKQEEMISRGGQLNKLSTNYRSSYELMSFINDLFKPLNFMKMESSKEKNLLKNHVAYMVGETDANCEVVSIARYISKLLDEGESPDSIAVIARKNEELKNIATELGKRKIPYYINSASGYSSRRETLDLLALLKFLVNPFDNRNLILLLRTPWFKVVDEKLASFVKRDGNYWDLAVAQLVRSDEGIEAIVKLKHFLEMTKTMGISRVFEMAVFEIGILDCTNIYDPSGRREANIWKLIVKLKSEEHRPGFNYLKFINDIAQSAEFSDEDSDAISSTEPNRVNMMTVHVSKGLQFKHVIIPFINKPQRKQNRKKFYFNDEKHIWGVPVKSDVTGAAVTPLPFVSYLDSVFEEELREGQRLLYVAVTRAKNSVYFSYSGKPANNSWLSLIQLNKSIGVHESAHYKYEVLNTFEYGEGRLGSSAQEILPRKPYIDIESWKFSAKKQSVTQILQQKTNNSPDFILEQLKSAHQGTVVHRLFELLHHEGEARALEIASNWSKDNYEFFKKGLSYLKSQTQVPLFEIIKMGKVEWGFLLKTREGEVEGQIDLWGVLNNDVWIIDYKTGNPKYIDKAQRQLELYSLAVQTYLGERNVKLCAIFPGSNLIEIFSSPSLKDLKSNFNL